MSFVLRKYDPTNYPPVTAIIAKKNRTEAFIELISILHILSASKNQKLLCLRAMNSTDFANSDQISKAFEFIEQKYQGKILLNDVAEFLIVTETTLTHDKNALANHLSI